MTNFVGLLDPCFRENAAAMITEGGDLDLDRPQTEQVWFAGRYPKGNVETFVESRNVHPVSWEHVHRRAHGKCGRPMARFFERENAWMC